MGLKPEYDKLSLIPCRKKSFWIYKNYLNTNLAVENVAFAFRNIMPSENMIVSMITGGEGWHNYHHVFPWDYRASELGTKFNSTGKFIDFCASRGWAYDLKQPSYEMIMKVVARSGDGSHKQKDLQIKTAGQ